MKIRKMIKSITAVIIVVIMLMPVAICAEEGVPENKESIFPEVLAAVYNGYGHVYDADGAEITHNFISKYKSMYEDNKILEIREQSTLEGISLIEADLLYGPELPPIPGYYQKVAYNFITQTTAPNQGKSWYFVVTATGYYSYSLNDDGVSNTIHYFNNPTYSYAFEELGALFSGSIISVYNSSVTFNSTNTEAYFYTIVTHKVTCNVNEYVFYELGTYQTQNNFVVTI